MIETAIRCDAPWAAPARQPQAGDALWLAGRSVARSIRRRDGGMSCRWFRAVFGWTLALILAFTALVSAGAAHASIEGTTAPAGLVALTPADAPARHDAPNKAHLCVACTGHCAAHVVAVPTAPTTLTLSLVTAAAWAPQDDQWARLTRPSRLERPPRA